MDIGNAVKEVKAGKIDFKVDKYGIIHTSIGKVSFHRIKSLIMPVNFYKPSTN
jgi:large subunit ribosomal protein L1